MLPGYEASVRKANVTLHKSAFDATSHSLPIMALRELGSELVRPEYTPAPSNTQTHWLVEKNKVNC